MQKLLNGFIISYLSPYLCGYSNDFKTQLALINICWELQNKFWQ